MISFLKDSQPNPNLHFNHLPENMVLLEGKDAGDCLHETWEAVEFKQCDVGGCWASVKLVYTSYEKGMGFAFVDNWMKKKLEVYRFGKDEYWDKLSAARVAMFAGDNS